MASRYRVVPPEYATKLPHEEESRLDEVVRLYPLFQNARVFEEAKVDLSDHKGEGPVTARPLRAAMNALLGNVEIALPDQPGYLAQALETFAHATKDLKVLPVGVLNEILEQLKRMEREAGLGPQAAPPVINNFNYQNSKNVYPSRRAQQEESRNGDYYRRSRETV